METITGCKICGFPMEYRPNLYVENGICGACINAKAKNILTLKQGRSGLQSIWSRADN